MSRRLGVPSWFTLRRGRSFFSRKLRPKKHAPKAKCHAILPPFSVPLPGTCHLAKTTACGKNVRAFSTRQTTQSPASRCAKQPRISAEIIFAEKLYIFRRKNNPAKSTIKRVSIAKRSVSHHPRDARQGTRPTISELQVLTAASIYRDRFPRVRRQQRPGKPRTPTGLDAQTAIAKMSSKHNFNRLKANVQKLFVISHFFLKKIMGRY